MSTPINCIKGLAAVALTMASPVLVIYAAPFGYGIARDLSDSAEAPASLALTASICLAALLWTRRRSRLPVPATPEPRPVKPLC